MYQFTIISIYPNISIYQFSIYKSINQSVNQSISQSINLSIQQSSNQSKKVILFFSSSSSSVFLRPLSPFPPLPPPPSHAPPPPLHRHHGRHHDHHHHHGHHDLNDFYDHHLIVTIPITITITCTVMNVSHLSPSSLNAVAFLFNIIVFSCNLQVNVKILVKKYPPSWLSSLARGSVSCCCCMRSLCPRLRLSGHQGVRSNRPLLRCPSGTCEYHQAGSVQTNVQDVQLPGQTFRVFEVLCGQLSQQRMRPTCFNVPKRFQSPGTFGFARCDSGIRFAWPNLAIRYLISKGANPNVVDKNGETAQLGCWSAGQD